MNRKFACFALVVGLSLSLLGKTALGQGNWPRFRGALANGVAADDSRLPDTWDQEQNVLWKVTIPGWGWGSPIVWGDRVFVSAVTGRRGLRKAPRAVCITAAGGVNRPTPCTIGWSIA